jgi:hypothetical protein
MGVMQVLSNGHVTNEALQALFAGLLNEEDTLCVAEHVADCVRCADKMADAALQKPAQPPRGLTESTMLKITQMEQRKKREFYVFCARVAACAVVTVGLAFSGILKDLDSVYAQNDVPLPPPPQSIEVPEPQVFEVPAPGEQKSFFKTVNDFFKQIPNLLDKTEDDSDDQTKK